MAGFEPQVGTRSFTDVFYKSADQALSLYARDYHRASSDRAVLCLHGLTRNSADFEVIAAHIASGHRVIVADQRGRGRSDRDPDTTRYNLGVYVQDMLTLLDHLGLESVTLIGTSMGGLMSMVMAAHTPERVRGIVFNDIGPHLSPEGLDRIRSYVGKGKFVTTWAEAAAVAEAVNAQAFPDYGPDDWVAFARRTYRENAAGVPVPDYDPAIAQGLTPQSTAVAPPDLWDLWARLLNIPILAIRGGLSDLLSADTLNRMQAEHPALTALTLSHRGHAPMLDEPETVKAIDRFLEIQGTLP